MPTLTPKRRATSLTRTSGSLSSRTDLLLVADASFSGLPPTRLWLELTETALFEEADAPLPVLHELKELGVVLVIDDVAVGLQVFAAVDVDDVVVADTDQPLMDRRLRGPALNSHLVADAELFRPVADAAACSRRLQFRQRAFADDIALELGLLQFSAKR